MQQHQQRQAPTTTTNFTNTAKLPISTVKALIASVAQRPQLWIRTNNGGQKRSDINALWHQVQEEVHLPADICRIKWGHLRDNFRKVFIRNTLSAEPPTTWRFYNDMRFMEPAVAENVMRHHRLREQSYYWQELHNAGQRQRVATTTLPEAQFDHPLQNQFNFSEFAAMFQGNTNNTNKRIKLEASESSEASLQDCMTGSMNSYPKDKSIVNSHHNHGYLDGQEEEDSDDDQFDEDAVSTEENFQNVNDTEAHGKLLPDTNNTNEDTAKFGKIHIANFKIQQEMATNTTETCLDTPEEDSDRMFLLSLLPYLRKVKDQRKLQVRQKLQDVLIEEFG